MPDSRRYSDEEAEAILRRALERQRGRGGLSRGELVDAGQAVGLDAREIDAAIRDTERGEHIAELTRRWRALRRRAMRRHALLFFVGNAALFLLDRATPPDDPWFHFPLIAWAIALVFVAANARGGPPHELIETWHTELDARADDTVRLRVSAESAAGGDPISPESMTTPSLSAKR